MKIPVDFVRKFLKRKGWKWLHEAWCFTCDPFGPEIEPSHPIRFLYDHVVQGHEPSFDCCHSWNRQVGRDTGEVEEWYRWFTFTWDRQKEDWRVTDCYQGCEGFEQDCPNWCWR